MTQNPKKFLTKKRTLSQWMDIGWQVLVVGTVAGLIFWPSAKNINTRRPIYNSLEECLSDWNNTSTDCEEKDESSSSNSIRIRKWYGPDVDNEGRAYHKDGRVTEGHTRFATTSFRGSNITRSGFGRGFSRGG